MRSCPSCHTQYVDGVEICARDGQKLIALLDAAENAIDRARVGLAATTPGVAAVSPETDLARPSQMSTTAPAQSPVSQMSTTAPAQSPVSQMSTTAPAQSPPAPGAPASFAAAVPAPAMVAAAGSGEVFDSLVGATLAGRYQIIRRIGEGGMGAVYEARHTIISKRVAVKVLLEKFLTKSDFVARLLQEARLASAIGHEHIVDVTDFGTTDDGRAFVAMEFLDGESLAQLVMREAPLPVERSLRIARQVASALGAAHAKGIVHRDVKPENVYLIRRGDGDFVKVVDFGISKAVKQGQGDDAPDYRLTHTGLLLGTPLYMSPEQARGDEDLDPRVDVWAMGVMLYECLTGEVPFRANNYLGIISQVLTHTALPPSQLRPELGIPDAVEAVVMHAMEKDRSRRYATMADVERDLERLLAGDQNVGSGAASLPTATPPPSGKARGGAWVWGVAIAALIGGVALALARPSPPSPGAGRLTPTATATTGQQLGSVATPPALGMPSVAPTTAGTSIPGEEGAGRPSVGTRDVDAQTPRRPVRAASRNPRDKERTGQAEHDEDGSSTSTRAGERNRSKSTDAVLRGALPSRSGEGYPEN